MEEKQIKFYSWPAIIILILVILKFPQFPIFLMLRFIIPLPLFEIIFSVLSLYYIYYFYRQKKFNFYFWILIVMVFFVDAGFNLVYALDFLNETLFDFNIYPLANYNLIFVKHYFTIQNVLILILFASLIFNYRKKEK